MGSLEDAPDAANSAQQTLTVRELTPADAPAMRALFTKIFQKEMSQPLWDWKYARPHCAALGVWRGDELVAHYGGMGTDIQYNGQPARAVQICDVMVDTTVRQSVRTQSPFFLSTSAFLERYIGYDNPFLLGFGFPSDRHMALAAHLKLYAPVGKMWELSWALDAQPRMPWLLKADLLDAANFTRYRKQLDALGVQQAAGLRERIVARKDADFVSWRYLHHPLERYTLLLVTHRISRRTIGLCVLKVEDERVLWMDAIAPLANLPALAQVARAATWLLERRKLVLWCSEPDVNRFGAVSAATALPITTPANVWTPGPAPDVLKDKWWLLAGDTDWL
ncbi:MAG TPA: GNAT family N-acetyltransferase [Pseudomonadales bacterium]